MSTFTPAGAERRSSSFIDMLERLASERPNDAAVSWLERVAGNDAPVLHSLGWSAYHARVLALGAAFLDRGLRAGDVVATMASNRVEHLIAELAALHCGAIGVGLYPTLAREQLAHVVADARPALLVVEGAAALARLSELEWVIANRPRIILIGDGPGAAADLPIERWSEIEEAGAALAGERRDELLERSRGAGRDTAATYLYTSGTTGASKGVVLTHGNLLWEVDAIVRAGIFDYSYRSISYLPMAHIVERLWSLYLALRVGGHVMCCPDPADLARLLPVHRPSYFMAVPRVWEKLETSILARLDREAATERGQALAEGRALLAAEWDATVDGAPRSATQSAAGYRAREGVLRDLRTAVGLDQVIYASCAAAPLRGDVARFFGSIGVLIHQGYGLTETGGPAVLDRLGGNRRGAVGLPAPGVEVRVAADGELLIRSPANTPGYRDLPDATRELFVDGDWLRSGDIGHIDEAGLVFITDRKKELIVSSSGKNIAPTAVESRLSGRSFLAQAVAHGDARPFLVALLTLDPVKLRAFAVENAIAEPSLALLIAHPIVIAEAQRIVDDANAALSRPEQIKRFRLLPRELSVEEGELTPTFKLRRSAIARRHQSLLDELYVDDRNGAER